MNKSWLLFPCLALAFALSACGGSSSSSDEGQIEATIRTAAVSSDPSKCTEVSTAAFLKQTTEKTGSAAVEACEKEAEEPSDNAESVTVSKIEVDGDKATADVAFVGSGFDGQTLAVALVKEGDQWKLDKATGFVELDKAALGNSIEERLEETGELTAKQTECIVGGLEDASQDEIEELMLGGSSTPFVELAEGCA